MYVRTGCYTKYPLDEVEVCRGGSDAPMLTSQGSSKAEIIPDEAQGSGEVEIVL
jgi:hypothetical protein